MLLTYFTFSALLSLVFFINNTIQSGKNYSPHLKQISGYFVFLLMVLLSISFGWRIQAEGYGGIDLSAYSRIFEQGKGTYWEGVLNQRVEIGYASLQWILIKLGLSFNQFLSCIFFLQLTLYKRIVRQIDVKGIEALLGYFLISFMLVSSFNTLRASLSTLILFLIFKPLSKKHYIKAISLTILAASIQLAALWGLVIVLYYYLYTKINKYLLGALVVVFLVFSSLLSEHFKSLLVFVGYSHYVKENPSGVSLLNYLIAILCFFTYCLYKRKGHFSDLHKTLFVILPSMLFIIPLYINVGIAYRFNFIYILIFSFLLPVLVSAALKINKTSLAAIASLALAALYFLIKTFNFYSRDVYSAQKWAVELNLF